MSNYTSLNDPLNENFDAYVDLKDDQDYKPKLPNYEKIKNYKDLR